jgi:hypothetical protein
MELTFNIFLFIGWLFGVGYKIGWTDYVVHSKKEVFQLAFTLMVVLLYRFTDQYYLHIKVADAMYWKALAVIGYFTFGWVNLAFLLLIVQKATKKIEEKIEKSNSEF